MSKYFQPVMVLITPLVIVMSGLLIVDQNSQLAGFIAGIIFFLTIGLIVSELARKNFVVYNQSGVIYCGPTPEDIPEDATDIKYFIDYDEAYGYANHIATQLFGD